jgi:hypothetical protein
LIDVMATRHEHGVGTILDRVPTIHFGRMMIIRPEQYLVGSKVKGVQYTQDPAVPMQMDPFRDTASKSIGSPPLRSWLLTLVEFDGDLRVYMRDVARYLAENFDRIYVNCDDFPGTKNFDQFWLWIRRYQITTNFFYAPDRDMTVARAREFQRFKLAADQMNAAPPTPPPGGPKGAQPGAAPPPQHR